MIREYTTTKGQKPTEEQKREIEKAKKQPIQYDEDAPKLSESMKKAFECAVVQRNRRARA